MKTHIMGRIWGGLQLGFWVIMIPWIILSVPIDLYGETHTVSPFLRNILDHPWVSWQIGVVVLSTLNMILLTIAIIWRGYSKMMPITTTVLPTIQEQTLNRIKAVQSFSKEDYFSKIRQEAHQYHLQNEKKKERKPKEV
ncbi:MAG: hypothetical protein ACTSRK_07285 [Promethearchaeota archaeon]